MKTMARIEQLPKTVANQISAGEVVERPASVVKELVENSIDAKSNKIIVEVENGGKDRIRVKDNGFGIAKDDIELAFSRYATSKIKEINDLYSIKTLGFRGEALASIASVSKMEVKTKFIEENSGFLVKIEDGKIIEKKPIGIPQGTDIIVKDLFYNTPARFKYMKTTSTEFGHVSNIVTHEALAYPEIQFSLLHNNKSVLNTPGTGKLLETIYSIYGEELVDNLTPIDYEEQYIKLKGYIATPNYYRASRIYELFFVNRRNVHNKILYQGVEEGYQGLLPPRTYPVVFISLKLNPILVDINVHPTKREVKFSRNEIIKEVIKNGIKSTLKKTDVSPRIVVNKKIPLQNKNKIKKVKLSKEISNDNNNKLKENFDYKSEDNSKTNSLFSIREIETHQSNIDKNNNYKETLEDNIPVKAILGQIHNTYIIAEGKDGLYIIDQHNAHERIRYEDYKNRYNSGQIYSQSLLVPIQIELSLQESEIINKYKEELNKLGIGLEPFGSNSFLVQEVPVITKKRSSKIIIKELIDNLINKGQTMKQGDLIEEIITYISCRGAIKAGIPLQKKEMYELVKKLFKTSNPYRCPHGRPIIIHLTEKDIEKNMGRI